MTSKQCFKCGEAKPLGDFYKHKMIADGHLNKCKECTKRDVAEHRDRNIEKIRDYDRQRAKLQHRKDAVTRRARAHPNRTRAVQMVAKNIKAGNLVREDCEQCGAGETVAHHDDYSKPLNVRWLCRSCHGKWHRREWTRKGLTVDNTITSRNIIEAALRLERLSDQAANEEDAERRDALDNEALALLETLAEAVPDKLDALRAVHARLSAECDLLKAESKRLAARAKALDSGCERVKSLAASVLGAQRAAGMEPKVKTAAGTYWLQASQSVEAPDAEGAWPEKWRKVTVSLDKAAARKALLAGEQVDGFTLVESESIRWR